MRIKPLWTIATVGILSAGLAAPALGATSISLRGRTLTQTECKGYVVRVTGTDPVVEGGTLLGRTSDATDWRECKGPNGAGFYTAASGNARFLGNRLHNIGTDGYRVARAFDSITFDGIDADRIRDDVFSLARKSGTKVVIRDSKVRGYAILSSRNTGKGKNQPYDLDIDGLVAENVPYEIGPSSRRDGNVFKLDSFRGTKKTWRIRNSVFVVHRGTGMDTPDATWENVTFVYPDGGSFPFWDGGKSAPPGVRITTDMGVYERAVAEWEASQR
jgi:hypothetical protein